MKKHTRLTGLLLLVLYSLTSHNPAMASGFDLPHQGMQQKRTTQSASGKDSGFRHWLEEQVWKDASALGVSRKIFDAALADAKVDWSLPDLVKPGSTGPTKQGQSEFGKPSRYFKPGNIKFLLNNAKPLLTRWRKDLDKIEQRYGVPREIILAIWGRESAFGKARLPYDAVHALATESYVGARKEVFYPELLAALQILEQDHIAPGAMKSSWAGALGHPQFMPSKFLQFAVDFDGDKHRNIWTSVPDTLASIANFLSKHGWQRGRDWGYEVVAPSKLSCTLEGPDQGKTFSAWEKLGIERISGKPFPKSEKEKQGFMLFPAGRFGPAFLVSKNFYVLKDYNESDLYALFIGHLADRMKGGKPFKATWGNLGNFKRRDVRKMQLKLEKQGHDVGGADGLVGFKTRRSVGRWQEKNKQKATCFPDEALIKKIR